MTIEQAKGFLAGRDGTTIDAAFERLRAHARKHQLAIRDVSRLVLDGELFAAKRPDPVQ